MEKNLESHSDVLRQLLELAVNYGKKQQNPQTGYLHYHYQANEQETHFSIPLYENFLFVLALLRSRTVENINEAKNLLDGLLYFQNRNADQPGLGNFPFYLHEFPLCKDRFLAAHIAMVIMLILKMFHHVLGQELKSKLEEALKLSLEHVLAMHLEKPANYLVALKIAAVAKTGGEWLNRREMTEKGEKLLQELRKIADQTSWYCPNALGEVMAALSLAYSSISNSEWHQFWSHIRSTWHQPTCTYVGPALKEWQAGHEPEVTLYDLFMANFSGCLSKRVLKPTLAHLKAVLIIPNEEDQIKPEIYPCWYTGTYHESTWFLFKGKEFAYCKINQEANQMPQVDRGFHPLRIVWGNELRLHSLAIQSDGQNAIFFENDPQYNPKALSMFFELSAPVDCEDREKSREVAFYIDVPDQWQFLVDGKKASTFRIENVITLHSDQKRIGLKFEIEEGKGKFIGHCMLGNRPSQIGFKRRQNFEAYDWQIFLRTLDRTDSSTIKATLFFLDFE